MKKNSYLVKYAKAQVGKPYWFGTFGQTASKKLYEEKKKQYPKQYTAKDFDDQYGQRVHDCVGLHNGALWSETPTSTPKYNASQDLGANGLYNKAKKKGEIKTFDKVSGRLVFKGDAKQKTHVGIYDDGYVYEAKGHAYGVKKTKFNASSWTYWAQSPFFEEDKAEEPVKPTPKPEPKPTPATPSKPTVATKTYVVVCPKGLNIRKSYSDSSPKIGTLNYGAKIQVSKEEKGWVKLANRDGWCCIGSKGVKYLKLKK